MHFISEQLIDDNLVERHFTLDGIPGILWMPNNSPEPLPLVLLGLPGGPNGLEQMHPLCCGGLNKWLRKDSRRQHWNCPAAGFVLGLMNWTKPASNCSARLSQANRSATTSLIDSSCPWLTKPYRNCRPSWMLCLPCRRSADLGYSGGVISIGVRLAAVDPRVVAAQLFAGSFVPRVIHEQAQEITIPIHVLLQWDDEFNDRQAALDLYDAFGSAEKTLEANLGGHRGVPGFAGQGFLARHIGID